MQQYTVQDSYQQYAVAPQSSPLQQLYVPQYYVAPVQYTQYYLQQAPPAQTTMVYLPAGAIPGMTYQVQAGDGRLVSFQVPAGCGPGSAVQVSY
mmetsp:Transcript_4906/g.12940  ORF Transcript_4906/g.12940 Transcript_4906/m.12940 type:complete len:94 (+) Transcript_4906:134-415(+)